MLDPLPRASFYAIQAAADGALVVLRHNGALGLIATIEERRLEGVFQILEQAVVFRPGDHRSRRHESRHVASLEAGASLFGRPHHLQNELAAFLGRQPGRLGQDDFHLLLLIEVVEAGDDVPAVKLRLIELLGSMIEAAGVSKTDGVGGGEEAERWMRPQHPVLIEDRQAALSLQHPLDHEHHVRPACVVLIEGERDGPLVGPGQDALPIFRDLLAVAKNDGVLADQVDAADVAVEVDADERPIQSGGDLLDMGGLAAAVTALDDQLPVVGEARSKIAMVVLGSKR